MHSQEPVLKPALLLKLLPQAAPKLLFKARLEKSSLVELFHQLVVAPYHTIVSNVMRRSEKRMPYDEISLGPCFQT
jgi:hypothetical protein